MLSTRWISQSHNSARWTRLALIESSFLVGICLGNLVLGHRAWLLIMVSEATAYTFWITWPPPRVFYMSSTWGQGQNKCNGLSDTMAIICQSGRRSGYYLQNPPCRHKGHLLSPVIWGLLQGEGFLSFPIFSSTYLFSEVCNLRSVYYLAVVIWSPDTMRKKGYLCIISSVVLHSNKYHFLMHVLGAIIGHILLTSFIS
jgi:hypothetical protein